MREAIYRGILATRGDLKSTPFLHLATRAAFDRSTRGTVTPRWVWIRLARIAAWVLKVEIYSRAAHWAYIHCRALSDTDRG